MAAENWRTWLDLSEEDLLWGEETRLHGHFPQSCFIAQQAAEKAMKALAYFRGAEFVRGHSIVSLANQLGLNGEILAAGRRLDLYYIAPRYPDALPDGGDPRAHFDEEMAREALRLSQMIVDRVKGETSRGEGAVSNPGI